MQIAQLFALIAAFGLVTASPLVVDRDTCQCAICDAGPGNCSGSDLDAYNACVKTVLGQCGRNCESLPNLTAQEGCDAANVSIQKPCENKCVQSRLSGSG